MNGKKNLSQPQIVLVVAILAFAAISLLLHFVSAGISTLLSPEGEETDLDGHLPIVDSAEPQDQQDQSETEAEDQDDLKSSGHLTVTDKAGRQLDILAADLPSFDFSTQWTSEDGTTAFVRTSDVSGILYLDVNPTTLKAAIDGTVSEYEDYAIPYSLSEIAKSSQDVEVQTVNAVLGEDSYTDIFVVTPDGLMQFTINYARDTDGLVYSDVKALIKQRYGLEVPEADTVVAPELPAEVETDSGTSQEDEPIIIR